MDEFLEVTCPGCQWVLIVNRRSGKIVETRKPIIDDGTGDRFEDARRKVQRSQGEVERKVTEARERERQKRDRLNSMFEEGLERARKEGPVSKPERELDLD